MIRKRLNQLTKAEKLLYQCKANMQSRGIRDKPWVNMLINKISKYFRERNWT